MKQQPSGRALSSGRCAVDSNAADVVVRILRRYRFVPENAIGKPGVPQIPPGDVVKGLGPVRRSHAVHLNDDESQLSQRLHWRICAKRLRRKRPLRSGIDVLDDWILPGWIEVCRPDDDPPDLGLAVSPYCGEDLRRSPAGSGQLGNVTPLKLHQHLLVAGSPKLGDRSKIDSRPDVHVLRHIRRVGHRMSPVGFSQRRDAAPVKVNPVKMREVRILTRVHSAGFEPYLTLRFVYFVNRSNYPIAFGNLILNFSSDTVIEIEMT